MLDFNDILQGMKSILGDSYYNLPPVPDNAEARKQAVLQELLKQANPESLANYRQQTEQMAKNIASYVPEYQLYNPFRIQGEPHPTTQTVAQGLLEMAMPDPMVPMTAGVIRPNFRNPEQIKALRRIMAEEQRARGPLANTTKWDSSKASFTPKDFENLYGGKFENYYPSADMGLIETASPLEKMSADPIDQILRGSWYHGMSEKARDSLYESLPMELKVNLQKNIEKKYGDILTPDIEQTLGLKEGFPISRHDTQSISNKLGEPAGVSLSLNPTVSQKFSADENIFRVMPLYGGPPTQRTVNLMTPEGRKLLNDAYDVVANPNILDFVKNHPIETTRNTLMTNPQATFQGILEGSFPGFERTTGQFNQALSDQLQGQGYRHILYNPQRWNEYEMLALDPKYALPLDYRGMREYIPDKIKQYGNDYQGGTFVTPKSFQGIQNIQDLMSQNASRLGDIYKERSWWDRINEGIKRVLLEDNPNAEEIIQKLKQR